MQTYYETPLDALCAQAIAMTRSFAKKFPINDLAADASERVSLRRVLEAMEQRAGLSGRDDADIDLLTAILLRERERETLGSFAVFDGQCDPELGAVGAVREMLDLTERGEAIHDCLETLRCVAHIRDVCRARIDAERLLLGS